MSNLGNVPGFHIARRPGQERGFILAEYVLGHYSEWSDEDTNDGLPKKVATQLSKLA